MGFMPDPMSPLPIGAQHVGAVATFNSSGDFYGTTPYEPTVYNQPQTEYRPIERTLPVQLPESEPFKDLGEVLRKTPFLLPRRDSDF